LKSQIGHPQGACGAAGVAATLVAMRTGQIPPTINLETPDPECDLITCPTPDERRQLSMLFAIALRLVEEFRAGVEELRVILGSGKPRG